MRTAALNQARLDWVTKHLKLTHYIYEMAAAGDATASGLRTAIKERAHLTETQINFARSHILSSSAGADLDESNTVLNEVAA